MATRKRLDPVSRPPDGSRPWDKINNKDPDRHYVLANPNGDQDSETSLDAYLSRGYEIETTRPGGPRPVVGRTVADGTEVRSGSLVLVSRPMDEHLVEWTAGQQRATDFDRKALKDGNLEDPMRGRHGYDYQVAVRDEPAIGPRGE